MKYIVYAFNYPTLCRALRYIDSQWGKENSILIFAELVSPLPEAIKEEYHATVIRGYNRSKFGGVKGLVADIAITHASCHATKQAIRSFDGEFTLVVFRDNEVQEATIIERVFKRYSDRCHLWIIEEGAGLYSTQRLPIKHLLLKHILFRLSGLSCYALKRATQGEHPNIEKIICAKPSWTGQKFQGKQIEKQIDVFVPEFSKRFAGYILQENGTSGIKYDYVFLTSPIFELIEKNEENCNKYNSLLQKLVQLTSANGTLLIKSHPRDFIDYRAFAHNDKIRICSALENTIPFECLYEHFGCPQIISAGTSVSLVSSTQKPTIFIDRLLNYDSVMSQLMSKNAELAPIFCESYDDLEKALARK